MGERSRGKDKGKAKKSPKAVKVARRPHELQQQMRDALKRPTDAPGSSIEGDRSECQIVPSGTA